jgi:uncharacterized protein YciI
LRRGLATASPAAPKKLFALHYTYDAGSVEELAQKRAPLRGAHLAHATAARDAGLLALGGAFSDAPAGGLLVFQASRAQVEAFAREDPYVTGRLVRSFTIREWVVVIERGELLG